MLRQAMAQMGRRYAEWGALSFSGSSPVRFVPRGRPNAPSDPKHELSACRSERYLAAAKHRGCRVMQEYGLIGIRPFAVARFGLGSAT